MDFLKMWGTGILAVLGVGLCAIVGLGFVATMIFFTNDHPVIGGSMILAGLGLLVGYLIREMRGGL